MKNQSLIYANTAVLLFGLAGIFARWIGMPALWITFARVLFSSLALMVFMRLKGSSLKPERSRDIPLLILGGGILALHWWAFLQAVKLSTVATGTVTFSVFPLFVTFLEPLIFHVRLTRKNLFCAAAMIIGVLITVPDFTFSGNGFYGILTGLLSALCYAVLTLLNKAFTGRLDPVKISFYEQGSAALILLPLILKGSYDPTGKDICLALFLGIVTTALAHTLFIRSLKELPASLAGIISSMETVYGILFALLLLGEIPSVHELAGGVIIVGTVIFSQIQTVKFNKIQ